MSKKRHRGLIAAAAFSAQIFAANADGQQWLGPNEVCAPDMLLGDWGGLRSALARWGVGFGLQEQTEVWGNLTGGIKQGAAYDGVTMASLCLDLGKAAGWTGARIFSSGYQIWGPGPTAELVGALQLVSSIEATPSTKLFDLWFEQELLGGNISFRFGQGGVDDEFMAAPYAGLFINSSFTLPPLISLNLPSGGPDYPLAAPFARLLLNPTSEISLMSGVFTQDPAPPGPGDPQQRDLHGTAFRLNDHTLWITELAYSPTLFGGLPGVYKIGMWYAAGEFGDQRQANDGLLLANPASSGVPRPHAGDYSVYAIANQMLWTKPNTKAQGVGVFLSVEHAPEDRNLTSWFIDGGVNWKGPLPGRSHDQAGIGFVYAGLGSSLRGFSRDVTFFTGLGSSFAQGELVVEATYRFRLTPWFKLQPDLQYVVNPGAGIPTPQAPAPLKNALVLGLRGTLDF